MTLVLAASGCVQHSLSAPVRLATAKRSAEEVTVEAGIVLGDRAGYLCLPFAELGLDEGAEVVGLESSCECVIPSLVDYAELDGQRRPAVLLEFVKGPDAYSTDPSEPRAARLGVIVEATLAGGHVHRFKVDLLHTIAVSREAV